MMEDRRRARIDQVIDQRTYGLTLVLEDLVDDGNTSAILRTCDAFGVQRVNLIVTKDSFKCDRKITQGAHKWLDVRQFHATGTCVDFLRGEGYRVLASRLDDAAPLADIDFAQPTALVFGNERDGVSDAMAAQCDGTFKIPMVGFVQSFNVSIAAGICLYQAAQSRRAAGIVAGDLSEADRISLRARYYRRSVRSSDLLLQKALEY